MPKRFASDSADLEQVDSSLGWLSKPSSQVQTRKHRMGRITGTSIDGLCVVRQMRRKPYPFLNRRIPQGAVVQELTAGSRKPHSPEAGLFFDHRARTEPHSCSGFPASRGRKFCPWLTRYCVEPASRCRNADQPTEGIAGAASCC